MKHLSDFKPLAKVTVAGIGDIPCSGLTLVVGPNSSGKSQFLQDLYLRLCGLPRTLVVASDVRINKPDYQAFMKCLETEGFVRTFTDAGNNKQIMAKTTYAGTSQAVAQVTTNQAESWYQAYDVLPNANQANQFRNHFIRLLVTALFLNQRLTTLGNANLINFETTPPQVDLHSLHTNDAARKNLSDATFYSFGKAVWPDITHAILCLRVSDGPLPSPEDRLSFQKMAEYRTIESEGDGLKSYVAICIALLLGQRQVCLIDEPEMCLHPPQAYNLGRFIGKYGVSKDSATFVATHSSQVLRGVVQSTQQVEIVRLTRQGNKFLAHHVPAAELVAALEKPTLRAESVLDGIFSESVVVIEGDGDRLVYQAAWEALAEELRLDVHFAAVGGTGGISDTCKLYRTLEIPVAVIADLDMIADPDRLRRVLDVVAGHNTASALAKKARLVLDKIKTVPPAINFAECKQRLSDICAMGTDWQNGDDDPMRRALARLAHDLDRLRSLKRGGVSAFGGDVAAPLKELVESLKELGIFLVPVGELEGWLASKGIAESKSNKAAWANAAALKIQQKGASKGDIWDFVREVGLYLARRSNRIAATP